MKTVKATKVLRTGELTGAALDWAVATSEKWRLDLVPDGSYTPSTNWAQGGPIIEREKITVQPVILPDGWMARNQKDNGVYEGPTPLIAAMRCYVASKLGDTVDVPEELL